jgi:16S rRNA (guanine966-N2)-methyltransferase
MAAKKTELRIVAGSLRGRKVGCIVHPGLRPTPQMVREALFSILGNAIPGRIFYDIFAGTGVVGIEAISRGASRACMIESDARQAKEIGTHLQRFGIQHQAQVFRTDSYRWAERWIPAVTGPVNLFLSPPFADFQPAKVSTFLELVRTLLAKAPQDSVLILQVEDGFPLNDLPDGAALWDIRCYGRNLLCFRVVGEEREFSPRHKKLAVVTASATPVPAVENR